MSKFGDVREQSADAEIYPVVVMRVEHYNKGGVLMSKHDRLLLGDESRDLKPGVDGVRWARIVASHL